MKPLVANVEPTPTTNPDSTNTPSNNEVKKPEPKKEKVDEILKVNKKDLKKGQVLRIENLFFQADSSKITAESYEELDKIFDFLR